MIFFTADTHFGHKRILEYCPNRPFSSVEEMNEGIVANWNEAVRETDTVYHLGDVAFMNREDTAAICQRLNGHKILIMGNHDLHRKTVFWEECGFERVHKLGHGRTINRYGFDLCHYPARESLTAYDEREYLHTHAPLASSNMLLHGHVHERWRQKEQMINVGVDVWGWCASE